MQPLNIADIRECIYCLAVGCRCLQRVKLHRVFSRRMCSCCDQTLFESHQKMSPTSISTLQQTSAQHQDRRRKRLTFARTNVVCIFRLQQPTRANDDKLFLARLLATSNCQHYIPQIHSSTFCLTFTRRKGVSIIPQ